MSSFYSKKISTLFSSSSYRNYNMMISKANRFQNFDVSNPKPIQQLHNKYTLQPNQLQKDQAIKDIEVDISKGSEAPLSYVAKKEFPEWYKPYTNNYYGHGFLLVAFLSLSAICFYQYQRTMLLQGRERPGIFRDQHHIINHLILRRHMMTETAKTDQFDKIPMIAHTKRYMKESGF